MVRRQKLIIKDERGVPNYMAAFSWTGSKDPAQAPPMFVVCGEVVDAILISQFHNTNIEGIPHSLPYREPWTKIDLDSAARACRAKGEGWHLLTNTEYAYLLAESRDLGTEPHGNTEGGRDYDFPEECGVTYDGRRTLTGLDPVTWSHDHTENGVYGLKGNVWEMVTGLRLQKGRVDYIPNNDAAVVSMASDTHCAFVEIDQSASAVTESDNSEAAASATRFSGETFTVTLPGFTGAGSSPLLPHEANDWVANTIKRIIDINAVLFMSISGLVWLVSLWLRSLPGRERCRSAHSRRSFLFEAAMSHFGCKCSVF